MAIVEDLSESKKTNLRDAIKEYLAEVSAFKSKKTYAAYSMALGLFFGRTAEDGSKAMPAS